MPFYGFKPPPKQAVENKVRALFGRDSKIEVRGTRLSPLDAKRLELPANVYLVECDLNDKPLAQAFSHDWRRAYKKLLVEVESAYERSLHNLDVAVKD